MKRVPRGGPFFCYQEPVESGCQYVMSGKIAGERLLDDNGSDFAVVSKIKSPSSELAVLLLKNRILSLYEAAAISV